MRRGRRGWGWWRGRRLGCLVSAVLAESFPDAVSAWGTDALVDRQCLPQIYRAFGGVAILHVALADSFKRAGFLKGCADVAGDGQCLGVVVAGSLAGCGFEQQFAEVVEYVRLAASVVDAPIQRQCLLSADRGGG
jgi:hypothetical protein